MENLAPDRDEPDAVTIDAARALEAVRHTALFMVARNGRIASWGGIIAAAIDAALPVASRKGVGLRTVFSPGSATVICDAVRLQQVLANLLNNAIKFTPDRGQISVSLMQAEGGLKIAAADTGQGIEPHFLARMFQRFTTAGRTTHTAPRQLGAGTGDRAPRGAVSWRHSAGAQPGISG